MPTKAHRSKAHTVALVSLGYGGTSIDYSCCRGTSQTYVNADECERLLRETGILFLSDRGPEAFEGAYVLDKRPAIDRHGAKCSIDSPMLNATLSDGEESPLHPELATLALMAPALEGEFQLLAARKLAQPRWRGLDFISLAPFLAYWRELGARVGRIHNRIVVWEAPPSAEPCESPRIAETDHPQG